MQPPPPAIPHNVATELICSARVTPHHRVVTGRPAARLEQTAKDRKSRILELQPRDEPAYLAPAQQLGVHAVEPHRVAAPGERIALRIGVEQVEHAALAHHDV